MADNKDILLKFKVDADGALASVKQYTQRVNELKQAQRECQKDISETSKKMRSLSDEYKEGKKSTEDYEAEMARLQERQKNNQAQLASLQVETKQNSDALKVYQQDLAKATKEMELQDGSVAKMRAELSQLTKSFDEMGAEQRDTTEEGKALKDEINRLTDAISEQEEATQRYQRNVGNYKSALEGAEKAVGGLKDGVLGFVTGGNPMLDMLLNTQAQLGSVKQAFSLAAQGVGIMTKQLLALIATPIGAALALISSAFFALREGIASSEERTNRFKAVMAPLQGILDAVSRGLGVVCGYLLDFIEAGAGAVDWVLKLAESLPLVGESIAKGNQTTREYIALEKERQAMTKLTRDEIVASAEREREISDLRAKFAEKDKYTNEQRLQFLDKAIAKEKEQAEMNKKIAQEELAILEKEAALTDNDAEMNDKLEKAKAKVIQADTALSNKMRELNGQRVEAINSINAEAEAQRKAAEERAKAREEAAKKAAEKELQAIRDAEDALNAIIEDNVTKQKAILTTSYQREVEEIKNRLATEADLTIAAKEALNTQLVALETKYQQDIKAVDDEVAAKKKEDEDARLQAEKEQRIEKQQDEIEARALALDTEIEQIKAQNLTKQEEEKAILEAKLIAKQEELDAMHQLEEESDAEFKLRQLEAANEFADLKQQVADKEVEIEETKSKKQREAYNAVMNAMDAMGQHSKALGKVAKVMGLAQIAVDTGTAISSGIAQATKLGFPANLAAIATTVATVIANMATAITSIKSAKFATGGLVTGAGSGTSDSIPAMLSNGESVMTAQATSAFAPLLSTINQMGGGVPIQATNISSQQMGEEMLARAVARGVAQLRPVVSVEEFINVSNNVDVVESLATL